MRKIFITVIIASCFCLDLSAQVRLASVFSDHMVLQQQSTVTLWGWAAPTEAITISLSWDKDKEQLQTIKTSNTSAWKATIKTPVAGGPFTISIKGKNNEIVLKDVLIGEVWICSGQSNMEWSVDNGAADAKEEMPKAANPNIRLLQIPKSTAPDPQVHGESSWQVCSPETMKSFSAVGYFFGKKLNADLKVPIGLINVSWGGTPAEVWTPAGIVNSSPSLKTSSDMLLKTYEGWPSDAGIVYNGMIRPLVPFSIAGVIWYQGEANTGNSSTYAELMTAMIAGWRKDFGKDFPFYYVQIAPYKYGKKYEGMLVREQQSKILAVPNTGMVVITDAVDNVADIHPKFKKPVGDRLANYALAETYKKPLLGYQSPVYKSMTVTFNKAKLTFDYAKDGLISHNGEPTQFTVAGADMKFYPAIAKIDGGTVIVYAKEVKIPVAVRFCFDNETIPNLFNKESLPVSAFRTDNWELEK